MTLWSRFMAFLAISLFVLTGCGGGGGSGSDDTVPVKGTRFSSKMTSVQAETVDGTAAQTSFNATIATDEDGPIYVVVGGPSPTLLHSGAINSSGDDISVQLQLELRPLGTYQSEVTLQACRDAGCLQPIGTPLTLPLQLKVLPNLSATPSVSLQRSGQEPAPTATVPVNIPEAIQGQPLALSLENTTEGAMDVTFDGSALQVQTRQARAGTYQVNAKLAMPRDPRYNTNVNITYVVSAPPGGELPLAVTPARSTLVLAQGETVTRRVHVQRPTWNSAFTGPGLYDLQGIASIKDMGNGDYDVTISAKGLDPQSTSVSVSFGAGSTMPAVVAYFEVSITSAFSMYGFTEPKLGPTSTASDLRLDTPVQTADGVATRWNATTNTTWLRAVKSSGISGQDHLIFDIDTAQLPSRGSLEGSISVSLDRPGVPALTLPVRVLNAIPQLTMASPGVLVGSGGWIHVTGNMLGETSSNLANLPGILKVTGARLVKSEARTDHRFMGDVSVLAVQVADAVPGTPITIRADTTMLPSQVTVNVKDPVRVPSGYATLPAGPYRTAQYVTSQNALYTVGNDRVYRWTHGAGTWQLASTSLAGVIDVAIRPDGTVLYATTRRGEIIALDPATLAERQRALFDASNTSASSSFDPDTPIDLRALAFSADARAFVSVLGISGLTGLSGVDWVTAADPIDLVNLPRPGGPGYSMLDTQDSSSRSSGTVRSPGGQTLLWVHPKQGVKLYQPVRREWVDWASDNLQDFPVAVSDDGTIAISRRGRVRNAYGQWRDLPAAPAATQVIGGYGLTSDGRYALAYGYRPASETGGVRAREATLWVIDLLASSPIAMPLALTDAVGCSQPATAEGCAHTASITVAEGDRSAFVTGPTGISAVSLGSVLDVQAQAASAGRRKAFQIGKPLRLR